MERIVIVGPTGCGKTTLACALVEKTGARFTDLDDLYWRPGWQIVPPAEFLSAVRVATDGTGWILAGNYSSTQDIIWPRADSVIWLDYSFPRVFGQLLWRSIRRVIDRTLVCNGNRETIGKLLSGDSILAWLFKSYGKKKRELDGKFSRPEDYPHIHHFIRLKNPAQTRAFLESLPP